MSYFVRILKGYYVLQPLTKVTASIKYIVAPKMRNVFWSNPILHFSNIAIAILAFFINPTIIIALLVLRYLYYPLLISMLIFILRFCAFVHGFFSLAIVWRAITMEKRSHVTMQKAMKTLSQYLKNSQIESTKTLSWDRGSAESVLVT